MSEGANIGKKSGGFWSSVGSLLKKVPAEVAGPVVIIIVVTYALYNIIKYLKNDTHITMVLCIYLVFGVGCTYSIVSFAQSKANERRLKSVWRGLRHFQENSEKTANKVFEEVERAVSSMRGEGNEH